jgi:hypothetical protein
VLAQAAERFTGSARAGLVAAWLYALVSSANVVSINAELTMNLPVAAALLFFIRAEQERKIRHDLITGLLIGLATLCKQQAGIILPALIAAIAWTAIRTHRREEAFRIGALALGFLVPCAASVLLYLKLVDLGVFTETIEHHLFSAHASSIPGRFFEGLLYYVIVGAPLPWLLALSDRARTPESIRRGLLFVLWGTWIPVSAGFRFYNHYYLQFAPSLVLLAAPRATELLDRWPALTVKTKRLLAAAVVVPELLFLGYALGRGLVGGYPCQERRTIQLTDWLRENTEPTDRLFVWGHYTPIYYLSQRLPGTRYRNTSVHVGDFDPGHLEPGFDVTPYRSDQDVRATIDDLESKRVAYVIDTAPADIHHWSNIPLAAVPVLEHYVQVHYEQVAQPGGAAVYRRVAGPLTLAPDDPR